MSSNSPSFSFFALLFDIFGYDRAVFPFLMVLCSEVDEILIVLACAVAIRVDGAVRAAFAGCFVHRGLVPHIRIMAASANISPKMIQIHTGMSQPPDNIGKAVLNV